MTRIRQTVCVLLVGLFISVTNVYAIDFYGADVTDSDVPSSYLKIGLFGFRPIVGTVTIDSPAAKQGFHRGDIIFSINGTEIKKSSELHKFTTDVLSVSVFKGKEKLTLTIDRRTNETAQTKQIAAEKQSATYRQITHNVPVAAVNSPPVKFDGRAFTSHDPVRREALQAGPAISRDAAYLKNPLPPHSIPVAPTEVVRTQDVSTLRIFPAKGDIFNRPIKPAQDRIIFESKKGDVTFSHSVHLRSLNKEQCMLCHQIENPTHESIKSRLDNYRAAHGFCRGCHQNTETAPTTECQVCHRL
jgi:membrane-associated protease RseP (regulator of RpoE activity)